jgi:hypothetical protein
MDDAIPQPNGLTPGKVLMNHAKFLRQLTARLTHDRQIPEQGIPRIDLLKQGSW